MYRHPLCSLDRPIISLNCNSIRSSKKQLALVQYLSINNPAIVLLQETRTLRFHPKISNYSTYFSPATEPGRVGTSILLHHDIHANLIFPVIAGLEGTFLEINTEAGTALIASIYLKCELSAAAVKKAMEGLLMSISGYSRVIVGGDFNCDFRPNIKSAKSAATREVLLSYAHVHLVIPSSRTFRSGSVIDAFLVADKGRKVSNLVARTLAPFSDHSGVALFPQSGFKWRYCKSRPHSFLNYNGINWTKFNKFIENDLLISTETPLFNPTDVDSEINRISKAINKAIDLYLRKSHTPQLPQTPNKLKHLLKDRAILVRSKFRELGRIYRRPNVIAMLNEELAKTELLLDQEITRLKSDELRGKLIHIRPGPKMFAQINRVCRSNKNPKISAIRKADGNLTSTPEGICDTFKSFYADLYSAREAPHALEAQQTNPPVKIPFDTRKLLTIIKQLNNKKSAGPDNISNFIIKKLSLPILMKISFAIHKSISLNYFPEAWKRAKIIVIPKVKGTTNTSNFRPISLVSCWGKIYERIILEKLNPEVAKLKIIPDYQTGFRNNHSTLDAAAVLRDTVVNAFRAKKKVAVCLLDISKAFDSVWREGLLWKLRNYGLSESVVRLISSFLSERTATVAVRGVESQPFAVNRGVPQGTVLGPILYNLFTADQPSPSMNQGLLQYADDTACIGSSTQAKQALVYLQRLVGEMENYYHKWGLKINGKKSELIVFDSHKVRSAHKVVVGEDEVREKPWVKYLGIIFTKLNIGTRAAITRKKIGNSALFKLTRLLKSEHLDTKVKLLLYKTLIRPTLTYGSPIWNDCSSAAWRGIKAVELRALRYILNMQTKPELGIFYKNKEVLECAKIDNVGTFIDGLNCRFVARYIGHMNRWIRNMSKPCWSSRRRKPGKFILTRKSALRGH